MNLSGLHDFCAGFGGVVGGAVLGTLIPSSSRVGVFCLSLVVVFRRCLRRASHARASHNLVLELLDVLSPNFGMSVEITFDSETSKNSTFNPRV